MKFSYQWLSELVEHGFSPEQLQERLTMAGLEVAGVSPVAAACSKVVVARVESVEAHPDAARLKVCEVSDGETVQQVVCGAPDVRAGMYGALAKVGAVIESVNDGKDSPRHSPGLESKRSGNPEQKKEKSKRLKIGKAKLRGIESHGMLCSAQELGLEEKSEGILELNEAEAAPRLGEDIRPLLGLDDVSFELDLTPNRGDCLGMLGLAREVGVLSRQSPRYPKPPKIKEAIDERFPVAISAPAACPRYLGRVVRGVNLKAATPLWMKERLRRGGLRSIDPVVDVTNYILLAYGQPLHAFDLERLQGGIEVRMARQDEPLTLLDGKELKLQDDTLVIADQRRAVAMAGIMGGAQTAVSAATSHILLECALFSPLAVAGRARRYGLHTDASHRYERGVDPAIQYQALDAATALLLQICGGEAGPVSEAEGELPDQGEILLSPENVERLLGIRLETAEIKDVLQRLGFKVDAVKGGLQLRSPRHSSEHPRHSRVSRFQDRGNPENLQVQVPGFRYDVTLEADLIEELARIHGYDRLPSSRGMLPQQIGAAPETRVPDWRLRRHLAALGYQEVISYSFIDPALVAAVYGDGGDGGDERGGKGGVDGKSGDCEDGPPVLLANPISTEMSVMRGSILPGLLQVLAYNSRRQQERLRIFELGMVFHHRDGGYLQRNRIAGLIAGSRHPKHWSAPATEADFYDIKGDVESLLSGRPVEFRPASVMPYHPTQCATLVFNEEVIGHLGALHPAVAQRLELPTPVFLFELDLESVAATSLPKAATLSRQPEVSRDLAVVVDEAVPAADIVQAVTAAAGPHLQRLQLFDVYRGEGDASAEKDAKDASSAKDASGAKGGAIPAGRKSIALSLTLQHPSRTLDEKEINAVLDNCVNTLRDGFNANLRS